MWKLRRIVTQSRKKRPSIHYRTHKEAARALVHAKLTYWNSFYHFSYNTVAIRNTKRNWGSCTSLRNLNFNYKILFLPSHLQDYIIVHELCHLKELHHKATFWDLVAEQMPEYKSHIAQLRAIERTMVSNKGLVVGVALSAVVDTAPATVV
jgi:predicted metal-dependent hydrolase